MIKLKQIRLINWYGFSQTTVPVGFFTLIAGKNGNGKSVLLDAIKYALYGDTVFNKSTENKGSRTVSSYTRGLLDATAGTCMRPTDKMPNVYTHIVLEMEDSELGSHFILGTAIDTDSGNGFKTQRYVLENQTLSQMSHTYENEGQMIPYSTSQLQKSLGVKMMDVKEGLSKFMQRTGLRLSEHQLASFRRKLRSIISYDPNAKIDQFIRESVLEEKKVDFSKLIEAKNNLTSLANSFEIIETEIGELDKILKLFHDFEKEKDALLGDDVKRVYENLLNCRNELEEATRQMEIAERQIAEQEKELHLIDKEEIELKNDQDSARENLRSMDCAKAIIDAEKTLKQVQEKEVALHKEKTALGEFQTRVDALVAWFYNEELPITGAEILSSLTTDRFIKVERENRVKQFLDEVKERRDVILGKKFKIEDAIKENQKEQSECQQIIKECNEKKITFSDISDYVALKQEINKAFEKRGIQSEARFACEYVLGLTDEGWRDAIEVYLGKRRYTILVEPEYYDIADDIFNVSKNKHAHLFNTKLLMKKKITLEEDAVVQFVEVKNPVAKQYFNYLLGRLHATTKDQVRKFENAISKEGRISVSMDSYFLHFDNIKFYCLGQETIELNRIKATKRLEMLKKAYQEQQENLEDEESKKNFLAKSIDLFGDYNYDVYRQYEDLLIDLAKKEGELKSLQEAQNSNMEYIELTERLSKLEDSLKEVERKRNALYNDKSSFQTTYNTNKKGRETLDVKIITTQARLRELENGNNLVYTKAIEAYDQFVANGKTGLGGPLKDRNRSERKFKEVGDILQRSQATYNANRSAENCLPITEDDSGYYAERRTKIWMDDLQEIRQNLDVQKKRYEDIFKNEFVLTVLKSCESAKDDLKLINAELDHLKFKSKYTFDVKYVKDGTDYEKILEYAKYLKEREDLGAVSGQSILGEMTSYSDSKSEELEEDIKKIINRIIESNNKEQIEHYADYRNYMTYEILLTNDVLTKAKLSRQSGYNSGAEVQIPYMLILISALLMIYNDKNNSTRLVFIDEPFAKMDPSNVKIMLGFMKEQNLQMIFCAPDKTELIGNACEVVLPVLRTQSDLMEIGIIDMYKGV